MLTKIKNRNEGFTIVETLIVLAIAGLIILIVLLAVPALQRSSRNSNIKTDASAIETGISDYESNNNGGLPSTLTGPNSTGDVTIGGGSVTSNAKVQASDVITFESARTGPTYSANTTTPGTNIGPGQIVVDTKWSCDGGPTGSANSRAIAIFYPIESNSGGGTGCIED